MALREILAVFGVKFDGKELERGNKQVDVGVGLLKGFGATLATAFALDRVKDFTLGMISQADAIGDQAAELNTSAKALQQWAYAGDDTGLKMESLVGIFTRLSAAADKSDESGKGVGETLKKLGVDVKSGGKLKDSSTLFEETGIALAGMADKTEALSKATQLFGRANAAKVLQVFKDGKPGIDAYRESFEKLGGAYSDEFIKNAGDVENQIRDLNVAWTSSKVKIVGLVLPAIQSLISIFTKGSTAIKNLLQNTNIGPVIAGAAGLTAFALALQKGLPLLKHWKIALAALAAEDLYSFLKGDDSLIGDTLDAVFGEGTQAKVRKWITDVGSEVTAFFKDTSNDIRLFGKTLSADVHANWDNGWPEFGIMAEMFALSLDLMSGGWANFASKGKAIVSGIALAFQIAWTEIKFGGLEAAASLSDAFDNAGNSIKAGIGGVLNTLGFSNDLGKGTGAANAPHALADVQAMHARETAGHVQTYDRVAGALNAAPSNQVAITAPQTFIFNGVVESDVPPMIARAAGTGAGNANRKAGAALVQKGSKQ